MTRAPAAGRRLRRLLGRPLKLTIRGRLTLVYGGLFVLAGLLLLGVTYVLVSQRLPDGGKVIRSCPTVPAPGSTPLAGSVLTPGGCDTTVPEGTQVLLDQATTDARERTLSTLLTQGGIALALVAAAATAFGWLVAGRLLQPLHRMTETARRIADAPAADRGLNERIALSGPADEVKELADTFDIMLERLDGAFDGQRRFIANASHELRTPLALNRTLLEVAADPATASPELRQLGSVLLAINDRHWRLIDGLLLLARSEREMTDLSYVDLSDIVEHVVAQLDAGPVRVHTDLGEAAVTGNPVLLERLVQNLVENGLRYNVPRDGWLRIATGTDGNGGAVLRVDNTGPVVPRYEVPKLFEPFHRFGTDRLAHASGAGLGLSIVHAVARAHDGDVRAEPRADGGLCITVTLPGAG